MQCSVLPSVGLQDDKLDVLFNLPPSQVLKILGYLSSERLVCRKEVKESRKSKRSKTDAAEDGAAPAAKRPKSAMEDSDSEYIDSEEEDERKREINKVKVTVYYINPCYFVDVVRYRVWRVKVRIV